MHDYNLKRKRVKPQETILDTDKFMFKDKPVQREYEEPDDPNHIVVNYVKHPVAENGPWALVSAIVATIFFVVFASRIYNGDGNPPISVTATGVCGILWSAAAVYFSIRGIAEKDRNHTLCFVGIALGAFQIITWVITAIITSR